MQKQPRHGNRHEKHLVLVGACYMDTILSVPHFPDEDSKLRATSLSVRRGGNCPNSLEVLQQLLGASAGSGSNSGGNGTTTISHTSVDDDAATQAFSGLQAGQGTCIKTYLVSPLPAQASAATAQILSSFGARHESDGIDFSRCLYREGHDAPASSYVLRSAATGSRTLVNYNDLPEMTVDEFKAVVEALQADAEGGQGRSGQTRRQWWWHFEGRVPDTTLECIRVLRQAFGRDWPCDDNDKYEYDDDDVLLRISVEVEKPGRQGLRELAAEADVVFYSRTWAEHNGYASPEECLRGESLPRASLAFCTWAADGAACLVVDRETCFRCPVDNTGSINVVDTVGAGDTFIAGVLFGLISRAGQWDVQTTLRFAVGLATSKVQREGFQGLSGRLAG